MTKSEMLEEISENGWDSLLDVDEKSSYSDVKEAYETMKDEMSSDIDMYPNGHDDED